MVLAKEFVAIVENKFQSEKVDDNNKKGDNPYDHDMY